MTSLLEVLTRDLRFGPFKTDHHVRLVASFREKFLRKLVRELESRLTIRPERARAELTTPYDEDRFLGPNSVVKYRYFFEGRFDAGLDHETASLTVDYDPLPQGCRLLFSNLHVMTVQDYERIRQRELDGALARSRVASDHLPLGRTLLEHWDACVAVWEKSGAVYGAYVGPMGEKPLQHELAERFAALHPDAEEFLIEQMRGPRLLSAGYAVSAWLPIRTRPLPSEILSRREEILVHWGCTRMAQPLGRFFAEVMEAAERKDD